MLYNQIESEFIESEGWLTRHRLGLSAYSPLADQTHHWQDLQAMLPEPSQQQILQRRSVQQFNSHPQA